MWTMLLTDGIKSVYCKFWLVTKMTKKADHALVGAQEYLGNINWGKGGTKLKESRE